MRSGRLGARRRQRADRVEADRGATDVLREEGVDARRALAGGQRIELGDLFRAERRARRRIVDDERAFDPVDALQRVHLRGVRVERLDVRRGSVGEPGTSARIVIGVVSPGANSVWSATYASRLSTPGG